jgi:hypothetical protein
MYKNIYNKKKKQSIEVKHFCYITVIKIIFLLSVFYTTFIIIIFQLNVSIITIKVKFMQKIN